MRAHLLKLIARHIAQHTRGNVAAGGADNNEVTHPLKQVFDKAARVLTGLHDAVNSNERGRGIVQRNRIDDFTEHRAWRVAQQRDRSVIADGVALGAGNELIEQRERVARRAATGTNHEREHPRLNRDTLFAAQLLHVLEHRLGRHQPERVVVGARANRAEHFVRLGRSKNELHVLWWLFDELEQCVEALRGHHVRLVKNENLESVARGRKGGALTQVARVVDAVVACRVNFDDVHRAAASARELNAAWAGAAGGVGWAFGAVEAAGEDARRCGLAAAARAAEQIGVVDPVGAQCRHQRLGHLRLADHFGKCLGPIAAIERGNHC